MAVWSLDICLKSEDEAFKSFIKVLYPSKGDIRVWTKDGDNGYDIVEDVDDEGNNFIFAQIRYKDKVERDKAYNLVKAKVGTFSDCVGKAGESYIRKHKCYWDETPPKRCELEEIMEST